MRVQSVRRVSKTLYESLRLRRLFLRERAGKPVGEMLMEPLERRVMLSHAQLFGDVLEVNRNNNGGDDAIVIELVEQNSPDPDLVRVTLGGSTNHDDFDLALVNEIVVIGGRGTDTLQIDADLLRAIGGLDGSIERGTRFNGNEGSDSLTIVGGPGNLASHLLVNAVQAGSFTFDGFAANGIEFNSVDAFDDLTLGGAKRVEFDTGDSASEIRLNHNGDSGNGLVGIDAVFNGTDPVLSVRLSASFASLSVESLRNSSDLIAIDSMDGAVSGPITLLGGEGRDDYEVSLNALPSGMVISIDDADGNDSLRVFGTGGDDTATVTRGFIELLHGGLTTNITHQGLESLSISDRTRGGNAGGGSDTFNLGDMGSPDTILVDIEILTHGDADGDTVNALLTRVGGALIVRDAELLLAVGSDANDAYRLAGNRLERNAQVVDIPGVGLVEISDISGLDTLVVELAVGPDVRFTAAGDDDTLQVLGLVGGVDDIIVRTGEVEFIGSTIVTHTGLASVLVDGRGGADFFEFFADGPTTPTTLVGSGSSELVLRGSRFIDEISIADGVIDLDGAFGVGRVAYSGLGSIIIEAGGGNDLIRIGRSGDGGAVDESITIHGGGGGNDRAFVEAEDLAHSLQAFDLDFLTIGGTALRDVIRVERMDGFPNGRVTVANLPAVEFDDVGRVAVEGREGDDLFEVQPFTNTELLIDGERHTSQQGDQLVIDARSETGDDQDVQVLSGSPFIVQVGDPDDFSEIHITQETERVVAEHAIFEGQSVQIEETLGDLADWGDDLAEFGPFASQIPFVNTLEVQIVDPRSATADYTLSFGSGTTLPIAVDAPSTLVQSRLRELAGLEQVEVEQGDDPGVHRVIFRGLAGDVPELDADSSDVMVMTELEGGATFGEFLTPGDAVRELLAKIRAIDEFPTSVEIQSALTGWSVTISDPFLGDLTVSVDPAEPVRAYVRADNGEQRNFIELRLLATRVTEARLSESGTFQDLGIVFTGTGPDAATFDHTSELGLHFAFEVSHGSDDDFLFVADGDPGDPNTRQPLVATAHGEFVANGQELIIGALRANLTGGSFVIDGLVSGSFPDPRTVQPRNLGLIYDDLDSLLDSSNFDSGGSVTGSLSVAIDPTGFENGGVPPGGTIDIGRHAVDFFAASSQPVIDVTEPLRSYGAMRATDVLLPLISFADWLDNLGTSSIYGADLPFANPTEVQEITFQLATSGTFTLEFLGLTTDDITYDANLATLAGNIETKLRTLQGLSAVEVRALDQADLDGDGVNETLRVRVEFTGLDGGAPLLRSNIDLLDDGTISHATIVNGGGSFGEILALGRTLREQVTNQLQRISLQPLRDENGILTGRSALLPNGFASFLAVQDVLGNVTGSLITARYEVLNSPLGQLLFSLDLAGAGLGYFGETVTAPIELRIDRLSGVVDGATNDNARPVQFTSMAHGLSVGNTIRLRGFGGNPVADGIHVVATVFDDNTFTLEGVVGRQGDANDYFGDGGTWELAEFADVAGLVTLDPADITPEVDVRLTFGIDFAPIDAPVLRSSDSQNDSITDMWSLTEDAVFSLTFENRLPGNDPDDPSDDEWELITLTMVTVTAASTAGATGPADLEIPISEAVAQALEDAGFDRSLISVTVLHNDGDPNDLFAKLDLRLADSFLQRFLTVTSANGVAKNDMGLIVGPFNVDANGALHPAGQIDLGSADPFVFRLQLESADPVTVTVSPSASPLRLDALARDIQTGLDSAGLAVSAGYQGNQITLTALNSSDRQMRIFVDDGTPGADALRFLNGATDIAQTIAPGFIVAAGSSIEGTVRLSLDSSSGSIGLRFFDVDLGIGNSGTVAARGVQSISVSLQDPDGDGRITILDLTEHSIDELTGEPVRDGRSLEDEPPTGDPRLDEIINRDGDIQFAMVLPGALSGRDANDARNDVSLEIVMGELFDDSSGQLVITDATTSRTALMRLTRNIMLDTLRQAESLLESAAETLADQWPFEIPFIGRDPSELNGFIVAFAEIVEGVRSGAVRSIQQLEMLMTQTLGSSFVVAVDGNVADFVIDFRHVRTSSVGFSVDLTSLGELAPGPFPPELAHGVRLTSAGVGEGIQVTSRAFIHLPLRLDFSGETDLQIDMSAFSVKVNVRVRERDLEIDAQYGVGDDGAVEVFIQGGRIQVRDDDGAGPAEFLVTFADQSSGFVSLGAVSADDLVASVRGEGVLILPIFYPTRSAEFGTINLRIDNLDSMMRGVEGSVEIRDLPGLGQDCIDGDCLSEITDPDASLITFLRNPRLLFEGIDRLFGDMITAIEAGVNGIDNLPFIGEAIADVFAPIIDGLVEARNLFRAMVLDRLNDSVGDNDIVMTIQQGVFDTFGPGGLGILKDLPFDDDGLLTIDDIQITPGDGRVVDDDGEPIITSVQWDFLLGQTLVIPVPFELGLSINDLGFLSDILPNFGFSIDSGAAQVEISWNFALGFGIHLDDLFYINTNASQSIGFPDKTPDLRFNVALTIPDFERDATLGLLTTVVTDGVRTRPRVRSANTFKVELIGDEVTMPSGDVIVTALLPDGTFEEHTINIPVSQPGDIVEVFTTFLLDFNVALGNAFGFHQLILPKITATPLLSNVFDGLFTEVDENGNTFINLGIILTSNVTDFTGLIVEKPLNNGADLGFLDIQFEDQRAIGLGFGEDEDPDKPGVFTQDDDNGVIEAFRPAPVGGQTSVDTDFNLLVTTDTGAEIELNISIREFETKLLQGISGLEGRDLLSLVQRSLNIALDQAGLDRDTFALSTVVDGDRESFKLTLREDLRVSGWSFQAVVDTRDHTLLSAELAFDLVDPNDNDEGRLTISELIGAGLSKVFERSFEAKAELRLNADANTDKIDEFIADFPGIPFDSLGLPSINLDFKVDIMLGPTLTMSGKPKITTSSLRFDNIEVDLGDILETLAGPIAKGLLVVAEPIFKIFGAAENASGTLLNEEVPILSDLFDGLTFKDVIKRVEGTTGLRGLNTLENLWTAIGALESAIDSTLGGFEDGMLSLGCIHFDPATKIILPCAFADVVTEVGTFGDLSDAKAEFESGGFKLNLLEPESIFNLILGNSVDIFSLNLPTIDLGASLNFQFGWRDFGMKIQGGLNLHSDLGLVYDSTGIEKIVAAQRAGVEPDFADLLDGFYIRNEEGPEISVDMNFSGSARVDISAKLPIVGRVTVFEASGSIYAGLSLGLDLSDPNEDGKLRFSEIMELTNDFAEPQNLINLFDITGSFRAGFDFEFSFLGIGPFTPPFPTDIAIDFSARSFFQSLFDGGDDAPRNLPVLGNVVKVGGEDNRVLRLNAGPFARDRIFGDIDDRGGQFGSRAGGAYFIAETDGEFITLWAPGVRDENSKQSFRYRNGNTLLIDTIVFVGTEFDDIIDFSGITDSRLKVRLEGLGGNDLLIGGSGADTILGGLGDDHIEGGPGNDILKGGLGADTILGQGDDDTIYGGKGNDPQLSGGAGSDTYIFRANWGNDTIKGEQKSADIDILDFTRLTQNLFFNITTEGEFGLITVRDGEAENDVNSLRVVRDEDSESDGFDIEKILGGRRDDVYFIDASGERGVQLSGLRGSDDYRVQLSGSLQKLSIWDEDIGELHDSGTPLEFPSDVDRVFVDGTDAGDLFSVTLDNFSFRLPGIEPRSFDYFRVEQVLIDSKEGDDAILFESTGRFTGYRATGNLGNDIIAVGVSGDLTDITDPTDPMLVRLNLNQIDQNANVGFLVLTGGIGGFDDLRVFDTTDIVDNVGRLTRRSITGLDMDIGIDYSDFADLFMELGEGGDLLVIQSTHNGTSRVDANMGNDVINILSIDGDTAVNTEEGDDIINVGDEAPIGPTSNVLGIQALLAIDGGDEPGRDENDVLNVLNEDEFAIANVVITQTTIRGMGMIDPDGGLAGIDYLDVPGQGRSTIERLNILLPDIDDIVNIQGTLANKLTFIDTGGGNDIINVHSDDAFDERSLDSIAGDLLIDAGAGTNTLIISDRGDEDADRNVVLGREDESVDPNGRYFVSGLSIGRISYEATGGTYGYLPLGDGLFNGWITVYGGTGGNIFTIEATRTDDDIFTVTRVFTGRGDDELFTSALDADDGLLVVRAEAGDDLVDASLAVNSMFIFGEEDSDEIFGGSSRDVLFGDEGRVYFLRDGMQPVVFGGGAIDGDLDGVLIDGFDLSPELVRSVEGTHDGDDQIVGADGDDLILGGLNRDDGNQGDTSESLSGNAGSDTIFGDHGRIVLFQTSDNVDDAPVLIESILKSLGGEDELVGGTGRDFLIGGGAGDSILAGAGADIVFGDNGRIAFNIDGDPRTLDLARVLTPRQGGDDFIRAGSGDDWVFAGTGADTVHAGSGDDLVFGDHGKVDFADQSIMGNNFISIFTRVDHLGGDDLVFAGDGRDIVLGQQGDDTIFGGDGDDNLIGGHNVPLGVDELDDSDSNDAIDGGRGNDLIIGDNGDFAIRGDSISPRFRVLSGETIFRIDSNERFLDVTDEPQQDPRGVATRDVQLFDHSDTPAANTFGADLLAGGAGDDVILAQLGDDAVRGDGRIDANDRSLQRSIDPSGDGHDYVEGGGGDDLIYGDLGQDDLIGGSSDFFGLVDPEMRPDGSDTIFGGDGTDIARNTLGDLTDDGHALDNDTILGDNGRILRLVGINGVPSGFLTFNYDNYPGTIRIIPRGVVTLDYVANGVADDRGAGDVIHGEAGDDQIYGMSGFDWLFGEGQDDDIFGGEGGDWIFAGSGDDGVLGDDGFLMTSRNSLAEPLYGIEPNDERVIRTPGRLQQAIIYHALRLNKTADLSPWEVGGMDVIFGGLGDDFLHGGAGIDGLSGAEALGEFYGVLNNPPRLMYVPGVREFTDYDEDEPLLKIEGFFLNFDATDPETGERIDDGEDYIYGDLSHDWLVGGTGEDRMFGGMGDDMLQADDNLDTFGGVNDGPDPRPFNEADFAFGGGGLDRMIGNTRDDRLVDWVGEFNTYIVPFSPNGAFTITRNISPHLVEFILDLSEASGADQSRVNPDAEPGIVTHSDDEWGDQHGAPGDPPPGNLPGVRGDRNGPPPPLGIALLGQGGRVTSEIVSAAFGSLVTYILEIRASQGRVDLADLFDHADDDNRVQWLEWHQLLDLELLE